MSNQPEKQSSPPTSVETETPVRTNLVLLALFWGFVGIPLLWGLAQTVRKALSLFQ